MGEAKRRKAAGNDVPTRARQLAEAWLSEDDDKVEEIFDALMSTSRATEVFTAATHHLPPDAAEEFVRDMFGIAEDPWVAFTGEDGELVDHDFRLFAFSATGDAQSIERLMDDPTLFGEFAALMRNSGVVAVDSNSVLVPIPLDVVSASQVSPRDLRDLASAFLESFSTNTPRTCLDAVEQVLLPQEPVEDDGSLRVVTRMFVGARLIIGDDIGDGLSLPIRESIEGRDEDFDAWMEASSEASECFVSMAADFCTENGLHMSVSPPEDWCGALGSMGSLRLMSALDIEAVQAGYEIADFHDAHVATEGNAWMLALKSGHRLLGPVDLPREFAPFVEAALEDWLPFVTSYTRHETMQSLMDAAGNPFRM